VDLFTVQPQKEQYFQELRIMNEKYDQLRVKLNQAQTLIRAGELTTLQELVRQGQI